MRHFEGGRVGRTSRRPPSLAELYDQEPALRERAGERLEVGRQFALSRNAALRRLALAIDPREAGDEQTPQRIALVRAV